MRGADCFVMAAANPWGRRWLYYLDVVGLDFDCGGYEAGQFYDEAAFSHAFDRKQTSLVLVKHPAHDAHFFAIHRLGNLTGMII